MEYNRRNTGKEKLKRNKGYPYKRHVGVRPLINKPKSYAIVDKEGKVLETFLTKGAAYTALWKWRKEPVEKPKIVTT